MLDTATDQPVMQRSHGSALLSLIRRRGAVGPVWLEQSGSAKVFLPRAHGPDPEAVFLNTSGGLTGGDRLNYTIALGPEVRAVGTTQTAERAYRSIGALPAEASVNITVERGARLDWLPQETILFENAHLARTTTVDLAADASCLMLETVILGRHAMGEAPCRINFTDRRMIRRAGRPVWAETLRLDGASLALQDLRAVMGRARAFAVIALVDQNASDALASVRAELDEAGVEAAATAFDGRCLVRLLARDGWPLRRQIVRLLTALRPGRPVPRVWQC